MTTETPDAREQRLRNEKLELECEKLRYDSHPDQRKLERMKAFAATSGVITAMVAVVGIGITLIQWQSGVRSAQESRAADRMASGLSQLTSEREPARLAGVIVLAMFLQEEDSSRKLQVVRAFANHLAVESSALVRASIVAHFEELDVRTMSVADRKQALGSLIAVGRTLFPQTIGNQDDDDATRAAAAEMRERAIAAGALIASLARKGVVATDLSKLCLERATFPGVTFPEGTSFDGANLNLVDFEGASLQRARFRDAGLARTSFVRANLGGADFSRTSPLESPFGYLVAPSWPVPNSPTTGIHLEGTSFECADLTGASFTGFPIFGISRDGAPPVTIGTSFREAKLDDADFTLAQVIGAAGQVENDELLHLVTSRRATGGEADVFAARFANEPEADTRAEPIARVYYSRSLLGAARRFDGSTWHRAQLPRALRAAFTVHPPYAESRGGCANVP